jgi:hypothetical protein
MRATKTSGREWADSAQPLVAEQRLPAEQQHPKNPTDDEDHKQAPPAAEPTQERRRSEIDAGMWVQIGHRFVQPGVAALSLAGFAVGTKSQGHPKGFRNVAA